MGKLFKKDDFDYFEYFHSAAVSATKAGELLQNCVSSFNPSLVGEWMQQMHSIENSADTAKHQMIERLAHEFMTPIEREDIILLAQDLDNVVDSIDEVLRRMYMFHMKAIRPEALKFAELICKCCKVLELVLTEFHNFKSSKTIYKSLIEVNSLESDGDVLYSESVRELFSGSASARDELIWLNIFEEFEECLDSCEDVADTLESIIIKNT